MPRGTTSPPPASLYNFRENAVLGFKNADSADAQIIGESIAAIKAANNNRLQPRFVFEAARSQRHPLHRHFEWNVQKAD